MVKKSENPGDADKESQHRKDDQKKVPKQDLYAKPLGAAYNFVSRYYHASMILALPLGLISINRILDTPISRAGTANSWNPLTLWTDLVALKKIGGHRTLLAGLIPIFAYYSISRKVFENPGALLYVGPHGDWVKINLQPTDKNNKDSEDHKTEKSQLNWKEIKESFEASEKLRADKNQINWNQRLESAIIRYPHINEKKMEQICKAVTVEFGRGHEKIDECTTVQRYFVVLTFCLMILRPTVIVMTRVQNLEYPHHAQLSKTLHEVWKHDRFRRMFILGLIPIFISTQLIGYGISKAESSKRNIFEMTNVKQESREYLQSIDWTKPVEITKMNLKKTINAMNDMLQEIVIQILWPNFYLLAGFAAAQPFKVVALHVINARHNEALHTGQKPFPPFRSTSCRNSFQAFQHIMRKYGRKGLTRGLLPTMLFEIALFWEYFEPLFRLKKD